MVDLTFEVWSRYFPETFNGRCLCCGKQIRYPDFHKGHIISDADGGEYNVGNLLPLCMTCNSKMGKIDFFTFKHKYHPEVNIPMDSERKIELLTKENNLLRTQLIELENKILRKKIEEKITITDDKKDTDEQQKSVIIPEKSGDKKEIEQTEVWSGIWEDVLGNKRDRSYCNFKRYKNNFHQNVGIWGNIYTSKQQILIELYLQKDKDTFDKITKDMLYIEKIIKDSTESVELKYGKAKTNYHVYLKKNVDLNDKTRWKEYANWILDKSKKFEEVFDKYFIK